MADLPRTVRDGAFAAVGLGILGFHRAQVQRRALQAQLSAQRDALGGRVAGLAEHLSPASEQLREVARQVDAQVRPAIQQLDQRLDEVEGSLPDGARETLHAARTAAARPASALRRSLGLD